MSGVNHIQYRWTVVSRSVVSNDNPTEWIVLESEWFNTKKECIVNYCEKVGKECDIPDSWESRDYIITRQVIPREHSILHYTEI